VTRFAVTVLGNNAALPAQGRHPTSQVLHYHDRNYLLDCGEGSQLQMQLFRIKTGRIGHAFITHLHGDHFFGLIGLITSMHLHRRTAQLRVFGPEGLEEIVRVQLKHSQTELNYPIVFIPVDTAVYQKIGEDSYLEFFSVPVQHRVPCCGFLFREKPQKPKFRKAELEKHGVRGAAVQALIRGEDFTDTNGLVVPNDTFSIPQPPRSYAFLGDTIFHQPVIERVRNVDTLYHESTFLDADSERAAERFHSTAAQAATIAKEANVKKLLLGHFSAKYKSTDLFESEAKTVFENTVATEEGKTYAVGQSN